MNEAIVMPPGSLVANVPAEVLRHIFYHLGPDGGRDQSVCMRVCKAWRVRQKRDSKWTNTDMICKGRGGICSLLRNHLLSSNDRKLKKSGPVLARSNTGGP
jgi:hypothetical protein